MKKVTVSIGVVLILLALFSCTDNYQRHYQLGKGYYDKGLINEAILEFKAATRAKEDNHQAHQRLAIAYTKKGWYDYALKEAETAFDLYPADENYKLIQVIKQKQNLEAIEALGLE